MKRCVLILLAALAVVSCSKDSGSVDGQTGGNDNPISFIGMPGNYWNLSNSNADFALSLFAAMNEAEPDDDAPLLLSPFSLYLTLGMLNNGAAGATRDAFMSVLGGDCADIDEMNEFYRTLVTRLPTMDNTADLKIANSQWSAPEFGLLPEYSDAVYEYFDADLYTLNLSTAVSDINGWCSDKTDGLIKNFYSNGEITEDTKTVLLDALYFKGVWYYRFSKSNTREDTFTNHDGSESTVSYMSRKMELPCREGENYCAVELPFGNRVFSMQIILPNEGVSLSDCIASLNTHDLYNSSETDYEFDVLLPKFSVEYKGYLEDILAQLGLDDAVYYGDYSNMSSDDELSNLKVKQATKFSIDEEGAAAASVTGASVGPTDDPVETGEFHVTRPFLYIVRERSSDTILFIGRITKL